MNIKAVGFSFCFVLITLHNIVNAQSFREGYIIKNSGDTVHGLIKYKAGKNASQSCTFKIGVDDKTQTLKPFDIYSYTLKEGKFYISKTLPVSGDTLNLFVEYLIEGTANVYYLNYANNNHYYIETEKGGLIELTEKPRIMETDSGTFILPPKYKGKLTYSLYDYEKIEEEVKYLELNHKSLINLAKNYHDAVCDSVECVIFEKKPKKINLSFGAFSGFSLTRYNFGDMLDSDYGPGLYFGGSMYLNNIVVSNERFSLQIDLMVKNHFKNDFVIGEKSDIGSFVKYEGSRYVVNRTRNDSVFELYIHVTSLKANTNVLSVHFPVTLNYSSISKKIRPYFGFGVNTMIVISQNKQFEFEHFEKVYGQSVPVFLFGVKAKAGISLPVLSKHHLFFEFNYDYLMNYNINNFLRLKTNSFSLLLGYKF